MDRLYTLFTSPHTVNHITPANLRVVSRRIEAVKPPTKVARRPRPLESFAKYNGTEYRNLAWNYWLPCAHDSLTPEQIEHFALFAEESYILNKDSVRPEELEHAAQCMDLFREQSANMFADRFQTYSLHLLKHIARCVRELGPLWVASGFWFESLNQQIKNYMTGPTDRAMQIACRMLLAQMVEKCLDWEMSPAILNLLREFLHKARWVVLPEHATGRFVQHSREQPGRFDEQDVAALAEAGYHGIDADVRVTRHQKVNINGVIYQPVSDQPVKYDNSVIHVAPPDYANRVQFVRIMSIIKWQHDVERVEGVIGCRFITLGPAFNTSYMKIVEESQDLVFIPLTSINAPAVLVKSSTKLYVSPIPNRWDVD